MSDLQWAGQLGLQKAVMWDEHLAVQTVHPKVDL
jgi:hypothetical protein